MKWYVTGDTHGNFTRFEGFNTEPDPVAVIILGDAGWNFYLNKAEWKKKRHAASYNIIFYCVRGNHEERPENIPTMQRVWDEEVRGFVYVEPEFPYIKYFCDGYEYLIDGARTLVIGGAYSIDKWYRLGNLPEDTKVWTGWFKDEQLTEDEMYSITEAFMGEEYDFVLSHTCPLSWEPHDLFLNFIDQSKVDKSMEKWLDNFKNCISWRYWLFGHYHADRSERPYVEQYSQQIEALDDIRSRWIAFNRMEDTPYYRIKSPNFYAEDY